MRTSKNVLKFLITGSFIASSCANNNVSKQNNADAEKDWTEEEQQLFEAAEDDNLEVIRELVDNKQVSVGAIDLAYWRAARNGAIDVVKFLRPKVTEQKIINEGFVWAAASGHFEVVNFLKDETIEQKFTNQAFLGAAINGHVNVVELLVDRINDDIIYEAFKAAISHKQYAVIGILKNKIYLREFFNKAILYRWYDGISVLVNVVNQRIVDYFFIKAAIEGDEIIVKLLMNNIVDESITSFAFFVTKRKGYGVADLLKKSVISVETLTTT